MGALGAVTGQKLQTGRRKGQARVVTVLGTAILRGDFAEGTNLPSESELTARFAVSRTVIREVMKTLAAKGLVVAKTKVGTRVAEQVYWNMFDADVLAWRLELGMDRPFLKNLFEIRLAVEPAAAALAAENRSAADVALMRAVIADMATPRHTRVSFAAADLEFHKAVAGASGNPFMRSIGAIIEAALGASFALSSPVEDAARHRQSALDHAAIVDAIEARDPAMARQAMIAVIAEAMQHRDIGFDFSPEVEELAIPARA